MTTLKSPLPRPRFFDQEQSLTTKKSRLLQQQQLLTPRDQGPPRPPVKTSSLARKPFLLRHHNALLANSAKSSFNSSSKALAVSFRNESADNSIVSKHYDESRSEPYFEQAFVVVDLLGKGSFGEVFKVRSKEDGKFYAVKKSRECFRGEKDRLSKLEEVRKHEKLPRHPNCVGFIKAWEERHHLYIQTELCAMSLSYFAETNHDINEQLIWKYTVDLLLALKHLHDHNLIHLDVKPANIFISETGFCRLGDFGLVYDLEKADMSEAEEGDNKYMAPELMEGVFTKAADIFSLGITVLELACDLDLPRGEEEWHKLRRGELPNEFIGHRSEALKHVILMMMNPNYKNRPTVDQLLQHPYVSKILLWRKQEALIKNALKKFSHVFNLLASLSYAVWSILCRPMQHWRQKVFKSRHSVTPQRKNIDCDFTFSDDDDFDDGIISGFQRNISNNDNSSDISSPDASSFLIHDMEANEVVNSTPTAPRLRSANGGKFPDVPTFYDDDEDLDSDCPKRSFMNMDLDKECSKTSTELKKNLLDMFDSISDDD